MAKKETAERLEQMGRAYAAAKKAAPTRPHPSTPNTPAELVQLGKPKAVCPLDQHDRGIRHVHTDFNNSGRDENIVFLIAELFHHFIFFGGLHASMQKTQFQTMENFFL